MNKHILSIEPRCVAEGALDELFFEIGKLTDEIFRSLDYGQFPVLTPQALESHLEGIRLALRELRTYSRFLRTAAHLHHIDSRIQGFDDHDQVASFLVYLVSSFNRVRSVEGSKEKQVLRRVLDHWVRSPGDNARIYAENLVDPSDGFKAQVGIVTALEVEFQSVVRRLDRIVGCTDDSCYGFSILDRIRSSDDLKDTARYLERVRAGWAAGYIGTKPVVVACLGQTGADEVNEVVSRIMASFGIPYLWVVVGICGGSDDSWPIGTVLISSDAIFEITHPSKKFEYKDVVAPAGIGEIQARLRMERTFRRAPEGKQHGVKVALPWQVPCLKVKFACTPHKVYEREQREAIKIMLRSKGVLSDNEEIAIEMEAPGLKHFRGTKLCIIKGLCDYCDERYERWSNAKVHFQLYAAETAAECTRQLVLGLATA